mmetsp:Transcript_24968/g.30060  ORF Transcript_24968/g.30060 Transcript_24968/m.30060 type:complete len:182 (-) Transcript_24968:208-753(-)
MFFNGIGFVGFGLRPGVSGWDFIDRSGFAEKSQAAMRREKAAKDAFDEFRAAVEKQGAPVTKKDFLLPPSHLTSACYADFRKHVLASPGWTCRRRRATEQEKSIFKEKRKAPVYFIDLSYKPIDPSDLDPKKKTAANDTDPVAKKQKTTNNNNWKSAVDPKTGRTYYYDRETRVTQWEKPY